MAARRGAGRFRHVVTLQRTTPTPDAFGQPIPGWADVATYFADVRPLAGREAEIARALRADVTLAVELPHVEGITPADRLRYGSRTLNIAGVLNFDERNRTLSLACSEVAAGA